MNKPKCLPSWSLHVRETHSKRPIWKVMITKGSVRMKPKSTHSVQSPPTLPTLRFEPTAHRGMDQGPPGILRG